MRTYAILTLAVCFALPQWVFSQTSTEKTVDDLFSLQISQNQATDFVTKATFYTLHTERLRQLEQERPFEFQLKLPLPDKNELILELQQHQILADDFKVSTPSGEVPYQSGVFYKGQLQGDKESHVALGIFENMVVGFLSYDGSNYELGHMNQGTYPASTAYIFYNTADMLIEKTFECGVDAAKVTPPDNGTVQASAANKVVKIYIEADYDAYQEKGNSVQNVVDYIEGFFNEVAILYANESINVQISEIFVWDEQDPYTTFFTQNVDGNGGSIAPFGLRMQSNGFNGDIAHLVQMVSRGNDGIAVIDGLCGDNPFAYSDIESSYNQYPTYSWTIQVFTHENGHVIGSEHTTKCVWGPNKNQRLEQLCPGEPPEGFCSTVSPPVRNTIMNPGCVLPDFTKGFGDDPGDLIRSKVASANCLEELSVPLDLLVFEGKVLENNNQLTWITANEVNTQWHSIERSLDGKKNFEKIGKVAAAGISTQQQQYVWQDEQPLSAAFYRIRTVDNDGKEHLSDIIRLERKELSTGFAITDVHPVPATDWVQVQFQSATNQQVTIQIVDVMGRVLHSLSQKSTEGENVVNLNVADLPKGIFTLRLVNAAGSLAMWKIVIQ